MQLVNGTMERRLSAALNLDKTSFAGNRSGVLHVTEIDPSFIHGKGWVNKNADACIMATACKATYGDMTHDYKRMITYLQLCVCRCKVTKEYTRKERKAPADSPK
jgi:hypothetical protein